MPDRPGHPDERPWCWINSPDCHPIDLDGIGCRHVLSCLSAARYAAEESFEEWIAHAG